MHLTWCGANVIIYILHAMLSTNEANRRNMNGYTDTMVRDCWFVFMCSRITAVYSCALLKSMSSPFVEIFWQ